MGHSQAEKAQSRERIVAAAARQIRDGGLDSVSIAELMRTAKLTHGGFYGHFPSRDALIAAALERALDEGQATSAASRGGKKSPGLKSMLNTYLSPAHRDGRADGCAVAALAGDVARAGGEAQAVMADRLRRNLDRTADMIGHDPAAEDLALTAWCTMVGAVMLSRVFPERDMADRVLQVARRAILDMEAGYHASRPDQTGSTDQQAVR